MPRTDTQRGAKTGGVGLLKRTALGVWDTFLRDNRVVPPVLAVVALLIFSWVIAGTFIGNDAQDQPVSNRQEVAQTPDDAEAPAPEIENPNSDSYAAYESKDPFRQLFQPADAGEDAGTDDGAGDGGTDDPGDGSGGSGNDGSQDDGGGSGNDGGGDGNNGGGSGNNSSGNGSDDDRPRQDNTRDPDSPAGNQYDQDETTSRDPNEGNGGNNSSDDDLFDSGGDLLPPPR